jgi:large subunit ribosomal protein L13
VRLSGRKLDDKVYHKHTGYLGHMKTRTARQMLALKPEEILKLAVKRMLPKGPLGRSTYSKLKVYAGAEHPHPCRRGRRAR